MAFAAVVAIREKAPPARDRSIWNPVSFEELSVQARSIRFLEIAVAESPDGAAGTGGGIAVGVLVGVAVGGTAVELGVGVRVTVGVAVGPAGVDVGVRVGVRVGVAVGGTGVAVGVAAAPLIIVKESPIAPVSRRNVASSRFPSTSSTIDPSWLSEMNIAGWFSVPPDICPELPATAYTAPSCGPEPSVALL